jgi:hypothetical protein
MPPRGDLHFQQESYVKKTIITLLLLLITVKLFAADISTVVVVSIDALHPLALTQP